MKQSDYAYSVAYVRAIENRLLTKTDYENLISAKNPDEAIRILLEKGYGSEHVAAEDFENLLSAKLSECFGEIREIAPKGAPIDVLLCKNDFHNLKVIIKGVGLGIKNYEPYIISPYITDWQPLIRGIANAEFDGFPQHLKDTAKRAYDILSRTDDPQLSDTVIDKAAMDYAMEKAKESKNEFLIGYIRLSNFYTDIKIACRCAKTQKSADFLNNALSENSGINREKLIHASLAGFDSVVEFLMSASFDDAANALKESLDEFEKFADNKINDYMKNSRYISLGLEPIVAYIHSKQKEIQTVRIIMSAKLNGISEDVIRSKLRDLS